jgi:hypothetical protein
MSEYTDLMGVEIMPLESGFVVRRESMHSRHRTAEPTLQGALTLAARALGYRGVIRFDDEPRAVEVPVVSREIIYKDGKVFGLGPGPAVDDDEPPLRAGTAKPGDKL